ncbi:MAG: SHOCT domain-containing protein [Propionivibrio sp.]|nr:SHOCT domain-containing protein [Propionivibrio sp.]
MTDLDRLERLNKLREAGALSSEEFEQEKQKLLGLQTPSQGKKTQWWPWAAGVAVLLVVVGTTVFSSGKIEPNAPVITPRELSVRPTPLASDIPQTVAATAEETENATLAFATSEQIIGLNPAYLEKKLGVPKEKSDFSLVYEIGGCTIDYWTKDNKVTSFHFDVTRSCQVTMRGMKIGPATTFGQILAQHKEGRFYASCLTSCGNAADPVIDLKYSAARVTNFVGIRYSTSYDQASAALEMWDKQLRKDQGIGEYDTPEDLDSYMCAPNPPEDARRLIPRMKVRTVWVNNGDREVC